MLALLNGIEEGETVINCKMMLKETARRLLGRANLLMSLMITSAVMEKDSWHLAGDSYKVFESR